MDLRQGIIEAAKALGEDPRDLATIISYETGGTFNPMQPGPRTQWGQHRGLIQFGEPQAAQHGVDLSSPEAAMASQLGADGAIVRYFRANGHRPGMGLLDMYSIVNAGAPGRYNASDANNGGAPGSVLDKVRDQMGGHMANADQLFAGVINGPRARPAPSTQISAPLAQAGFTQEQIETAFKVAEEQRQPQVQTYEAQPQQIAPIARPQAAAYQASADPLQKAMQAIQTHRTQRKGLLSWL